MTRIAPYFFSDLDVSSKGFIFNRVCWSINDDGGYSHERSNMHGTCVSSNIKIAVSIHLSQLRQRFCFWPQKRRLRHLFPNTFYPLELFSSPSEKNGGVKLPDQSIRQLGILFRHPSLKKGSGGSPRMDRNQWSLKGDCGSLKKRLHICPIRCRDMKTIFKLFHLQSQAF
jgi:hypothetical protein